MKQNEQEIIDRILDGEERAYAVLIDRYKEGLYRHCFKFVRNEATAEDLAQEAFIKAYVSLADFDKVHAFSTWLYKIATNLALSELRRKRPVTMDEATMNVLASDLPGAEQSAFYHELDQAINKLSDRHRTVVRLHYFKGKKYEEIAQQMHTTSGTVKGWMSRAKKQLKEMLS